MVQYAIHAKVRRQNSIGKFEWRGFLFETNSETHPERVHDAWEHLNEEGYEPRAWNVHSDEYLRMSDGVIRAPEYKD